MNSDFKEAMIKQSNLGSIVFFIIDLYKNINVKRMRLKRWEKEK